MTEVVVPGRFNGPVGSGNGGYCCGAFARAAGLARAEVTLRLPPPLDTPLTVEDGTVRDGDAVVATVAEAAPLDDVVPPPFPGWDAARAAEARYEGLRDHPFPTCFACGPERADGLGLRPGPLGELVATTWTPREVAPELVWAALDCPGAWGLVQTAESPVVLGRLAVEITGTVHATAPHVVVGWRLRPREGRKHFAGTALFDAAGTLLARGRATWVALQSTGAS